jgi:hypothetical protein
MENENLKLEALIDFYNAMLKNAEDGKIDNTPHGRIYCDGKESVCIQILEDLNELKKHFAADRTKMLFDFFMWFRENGEKYIDKSIEKMIEIYENEKLK